MCSTDFVCGQEQTNFCLPRTCTHIERRYNEQRFVNRQRTMKLHLHTHTYYDAQQSIHTLRNNSRPRHDNFDTVCCRIDHTLSDSKLCRPNLTQSTRLLAYFGTVQACILDSICAWRKLRKIVDPTHVTTTKSNKPCALTKQTRYEPTKYLPVSIFFFQFLIFLVSLSANEKRNQQNFFVFQKRKKKLRIPLK